MKFFLLDYDHDTAEVNIEDTKEALAAYGEREREALGSSHEVVLFYGDSIDDLRKTHSRYFMKPLPESERMDFDELKALLDRLAPVTSA